MALDYELGSTQYLTLPALTLTARCTYTVWATLESIAGDPPFHQCTTGGTGALFFRVNNTGTVTFQMRQSNGTLKNVNTIGTITPGTEYFLVFMADGSDLKVYFNTVADGNTTAYDDTVIGTANTFTMCRSAAEFMDGVLFDFRIYDRALSQAEIDILYASRGNDNIVNDIRLRYKMDEGTAGSTAAGAGSVIDISKNSYHATASNSPVYKEASFKTGK